MMGLNEELGVKSDRFLVNKLSKQISLSWPTKTNYLRSLSILVVGGLQGSGKTTVLNLLQKNNKDLIVISPDQIRYELFARKIKFSEEFIHTVNATRNNLLKIALSKNRNIAIDQFITPERIKVIEKITEKHKNYRVMKILLWADVKTLVQRVKDRINLHGVYKGTVDELKASIKKYGNPDINLYDKVLDTKKLSPLEIAEKIGKFAKLTADLR